MRITGSTSTLPWKEIVGGRGVISHDPLQYSEFERVNRSGNFQFSRSTIKDEIRKATKVNGWRPPMPYQMSETINGTVSGSTRVYLEFASGQAPRQASWVEWAGVIEGLSAQSTIVPATSNEWNRLQARALSRLKNQQVNLALVLATRKQTVDMLADSARRLVKAYSFAKRRQFSAAAKELGVRNNVRQGTRSASSGWLQLQFGWRPLVNDIYGLYNEACMDSPEEDMVVVKATDSSSEIFRSERKYTPFSTPVNPGTVSAHLLTSYRRDLKVSWWFKLNTRELHAAARNGLTNPAIVVWDLVPFSFVIDWLLPVGQYLNNLDADVGFTYLGGSRTQFHRINTSVEKSSTNLKPVSPYGKVSGKAKFSGSASLVKMVREVTQSPSASVYVRNPFSSFTVASTAALIFQRAKRK